MNTNLGDFKKYCGKYQNTFAPGEVGKEHDRLVRRILKNPMLIKLRDVHFGYKEVGLIGEDKSGRIDLVFITNEEVSYICEVKASSKDGRGIETQLERYYAWVRDNFGITPTRIGIQLTKTGGLKKKIISAEIEDLFQLDLIEKGECQNETRIL